MTRLVVTTVGPASSVQDGGRPGSQRYGLAPGGAMDPLGLAVANILLGNDPFAAAVEIGPLGAAFTACDGALRLALAGASRVADIAGRPAAFDSTMIVKEGETLTLGNTRDGCFSYLALEGGIRGTPMFGSLSVNARAGMGSPYPRPLQAGDELPAQTAAIGSENRIELPRRADAPIRVIMGPQNDEFSEDAIALFLSTPWAVSAVSDRMGYRLEGPPLVHRHGHNIVSDGTVNGSIQVPGNGQPIVLMPDRGTSGGYPKIATVISADLGRLAQTPPGQRVRFQAVNLTEAHAELRAFADLIRTLPDRLRPADGSGVNIEALQDANLAGIAVSAIDPGTWQNERGESS